VLGIDNRDCACCSGILQTIDEPRNDASNISRPHCSVADIIVLLLFEIRIALRSL
jgi:hypothetical protein